MNFAKKQLEKYGWTEGQGLGKNENGLKEALKPKPKHGTGGIGHNVADEYTNNWWNRIYNRAAENIQINAEETGEVQKLSTKTNDTFNIDTRKFTKSKKTLSNNNSSYLQNFVKKATLKGGHMEEKCQNKEDSSDSEDEKGIQSVAHIMTDEQLFALCGGRTAHKGARHGLKSNGKLARILDQEQELYISLKRNRDKMVNKKSDGDTEKTCNLNENNIEKSLGIEESTVNENSKQFKKRKNKKKKMDV